MSYTSFFIHHHGSRSAGQNKNLSEATKSELNFIKDALKRKKSKFQRGISNAHTPKDLGKTFHELNKLAESVVKGNFGALR